MDSNKNQKFINFLNFVKLLRVEPYLFLVMFQHALKHMPAHQLLQDKICLDWYNGSEVYCRELPHLHEPKHPGPGQFKSQILSDVAQFSTYHTYISLIPALIWSLFVGAWIDRYIKARKLMMVFSVGAAVVENLMTIYLTINFDINVYYNLLLHIPSSICGGHIAARIAITHYMTTTTPPKLMSMRLAFIEMCFFVANPIGTSLSGYILVQDSVFKTGEIRNYTFIFIVALVFELLALLWIVFMVNEKVARKQEIKIEMKIQGLTKDNTKDHGDIQLKSDMSKEDEARHPLSLLFNLENIKLMIKTCTKKRPNKVRTQLYMIFAAMVTGSIALHGGGHIAHQFIQKIYRWKLDWTAYVHSMNMVIHSIATLTIVPFMIKVMEVSDVCLAIIGFLTYFARNLLMGTWLNPNALYISLIITSIGGVSLIGSRSHLTKIVERDEIGKVMSFLSVLETLSPIFSSTLFAYIFMFTIDSYPGLVYQITAFILIFPIVMFMWIDLYTESPLSNKKKNEKGQNIEINEINKNDSITVIGKELDETDVEQSKVNFERRLSEMVIG